MTLQIILTASETTRFWSKVNKTNACWLWTGEKNNQGYGRFTIWRKNSRKRLLAHRAAYQLVTGQQAAGTVLLHQCDTPLCCNPEHLMPGTQAENIADARAKGRMVPPPRMQGERNPHARLTESQVRKIRERYAPGSVTQQELADEFGVHQTLVSHIVRGKAWRHVSAGNSVAAAPAAGRR